MENNKVSVKIYGVEYTIAGSKPRDHIMKVADHVDNKMYEIAKALSSGSTADLAVLAAVNIADEYFSNADDVEELRTQNDQFTKDINHYIDLWEEAKRNFLQYKNENQSVLEQKEGLQLEYSEKSKELEELAKSFDELQEKYDRLVSKNEDLTGKMKEEEENKESTSTELKELEAKYKDMESNFFDIQMENIQLKGELDRYKKMKG